MITASELLRLNQDFGLDGALRFEQGDGGLVRVQVATTAAAAEIYLQGAHVTRWQPAGAAHPGLFLSRNAIYAPGKSIRGGVPVVFPWFGDRTKGLPGPAHGFARTEPWSIATTERLAEGIAITFALEANETSRSFGYDHFSLRYRVVVGAALQLSLHVRNTGSTALPVQDALHTYFAVSDIHQVTVTGLAGSEYFDKADGMQRKRQQEEAIHFTGETDQLHVGTQAPVTIHDPGWKREIAIEKQGSGSTVVWNPWLGKGEALTDLGPDAWPEMLCVEAANTATDNIEVPPGGEHVMGMTIACLYNG